MAYIGLAKPTIAKRNDDGTYTGGFRCGKAIETSVTPQYAEGTLFGDNTTAEYDKEFKYADLVLNTTTLPIEAHNTMFGHTIDESENKSITFKAEDEAGYVGYGFYTVEKTNGKKTYEACWLPKCKFSEGAVSYKTKGDNIEYQTPSLTGQAHALDDGTWKEVQVFDTEKQAQDWIEVKAGMQQEAA